MSEAPPTDSDDIDRADEIFAEVAELDLALLKHVHALALATTDPEVLNGLVRSCQRLSRSVRQTLAIKAKLQRDRAQDEARACDEDEPDDDEQNESPAAARDRARREIRLTDLQAAGARMLAKALPKERHTEAAERLDAYLDLVDLADDFGRRPLAHDLADLAEHFELPADLVARWETLPEAPWLDADFAAVLARRASG